MHDLETMAAALAEDPAATALAFDFDGTLSPIVTNPAAAAPAVGAMAVLGLLTRRFARVLLVSGRPRSFLSEFAPASVDLAGVYGLETRIGGVETDHPAAAPWRPVVATVAADAEAQPGWAEAGVVVESKGLSLTVHVRSAAHLEAEVGRWAIAIGKCHGLDVRPAKASVELHPDVDVDKGTMLAALTGHCRTVLFAGDDVGDRSAFEAVRERRRNGASGYTIAVGGADVPDEIRPLSDVVLDTPAQLVAFLERVAARAGS